MATNPPAPAARPPGTAGLRHLLARLLFGHRAPAAESGARPSRPSSPTRARTDSAADLDAPAEPHQPRPALPPADLGRSDSARDTTAVPDAAAMTADAPPPLLRPLRVAAVGVEEAQATPPPPTTSTPPAVRLNTSASSLSRLAPQTAAGGMAAPTVDTHMAAEGSERALVVGGMDSPRPSEGGGGGPATSDLLAARLLVAQATRGPATAPTHCLPPRREDLTLIGQSRGQAATPAAPIAASGLQPLPTREPVPETPLAAGGAGAFGRAPVPSPPARMADDGGDGEPEDPLDEARRLHRAAVEAGSIIPPASATTAAALARDSPLMMLAENNGSGGGQATQQQQQQHGSSSRARSDASGGGDSAWRD
jgi:hypothetical protein